MIIPVGTVFSIQIYTSASSTVNICLYNIKGINIKLSNIK